jgi:hypothetical protein
MRAWDRENRARVFLISLVVLSSACGDNILARHGGGPEGGGDPDARPDAADAVADVDALADLTTDLSGDTDVNDATGEAGPGTNPDGGDAADSGDASADGDAANDLAATDGPPNDGGLTNDGGLAGDGPSEGDANVGDVAQGDAGGDVGPSDGGDARPPQDPTCSITDPVLDVEHPMLNGVPEAEGGDRASAGGAPYAAAFEVTTSLADNQLVELVVDNLAAPGVTTVYMAQVSSGRARFPAVALPVDGFYEAHARCVTQDGRASISDTATYEVDTTPPVFDLTEPHSGDFIPPSGLTNGTFPVCGGTSSPDAVDLDPALGPRSANGCVAAGGSPTCFPVPMTNTQGCLPVPCPGDAPFDVIVTLGDVAGNVQRTVISDVTCFSTLPSVVIVSPQTDAPTFTDPSGHLLASSAPQTLRDNAAAAGAQTDIVACASRTGTIALFVGHKSDATLTALGAPKSTRMAVAGDLCPAGFRFAATFAGVTLPESTENMDTSLLDPTKLRVDLVDQSSAKNSSPVVDLWVDSVAPVLLIAAPVDICNSYHQSNDVYFSTETVTSTAPFVELTLTNSTSTQNYSSMNFTSLTFPFVVFTQGASTLSGTARDAAGNVSLAQPNPCVVTVGTGPTPPP